MTGLSWIHDIIVALIVSGIPVTVLGRPIWKTHRQTKTSNGTTLAHLVEKQGAFIGSIMEEQQTIKADIAGLARYIGEQERDQHGNAIVPLQRRSR